MASELGAREDGSCSELAKPLYLQYLEKALQLDQFLRQTSAIFNRSISRYQKLFHFLLGMPRKDRHFYYIIPSQHHIKNLLVTCSLETPLL